MVALISSDLEQRARLLAPVLIAATCVLVAQRTAIDPNRLVEAGALFDDAFFYMVIADAAANRNALEFHPGMPTNGFQPLWMGLVYLGRVVLPVLPADRLVVLLSGVCFILGAVTWLRLLGRRFEPSIIIGFFALTALSARFLEWTLQGLETSLLWAVLPLFGLAMAKADEEKTDRFMTGLWVGLTAGLLFLARVDCFPFALYAAAFILRRGQIRTLAGAGVGMAVLASPYLAANLIIFDGLMPLSGRAKRFYLSTFYPTWPEYFASSEWHGLYDALRQLPFRVPHFNSWLYRVGLMAAGLGLVAFVGQRRNRLIANPSGRRIIRIFVWPAAIHLAVMFLYHRELRDYTSYYFMPEFVLFALSLSIAARAALMRVSPRVTAISIGIAVAVWLLAVTEPMTPSERWVDRLAMARLVREQVAPDATVGAYWPGAFAYYSERSILPLDGIIASREYQDEVVFSQTELDDLCARPDPHLLISLERPADEFFEEPPVGPPTEWSQAGGYQMVRFGLDRFSLRAQRGIWALFELEGCDAPGDR